ncbi:tetratricopeptide repeat protein [Candidatus Woesearchaeota archaeon]|nr:tetratricopeptide repeat protein [Candidatus Woesearchaeota archaeon]
MRKKEMNPKRKLGLLLFILVIILVLILNIQNKKGKEQKSIEPNTLEMMQLASDLYGNGKYVEALQQYKKIIGKEPKNYGAYIGLGHSYLQLGIYEGAIQNFDKTFQTGYVDFRTYYGLGLAYYSMEDYNRAYANLKQAYDLNPGNTAVVSYLLNTYNALGLYDETIKLAKAQLATDANSSHHYYRKMAIAYFLKGNLPEALANSQKSLELNDSYPPNHLTLGTFYIGLGKKEEALNEFKFASTIAKSDTVYAGLSLTYSLLGDIANSQQNARLATFYPKHSFSTSLLGFALLYINENGKAIEEFNSAISNEQGYYLPYKGLGKAYMALGQKGKAIENLELAAKLNGLDEESKKLLEEANKS